MSSDEEYDLAEHNEARRKYTLDQPERTKDGRKKKGGAKQSGGFQSMGLSYPVYKGVVHMGYKVPTPIQRKCIPLILDGKDAVAMARTGSGKTAAFLIPMLETLKMHSAKVGIRALILSPTRELALQTLKFSKQLGKHTDLRYAVVLGGDSMEQQFSDIHSNPDVVVATPGRLLHIVVEMELVLSTVKYLVFDEADRLFEMGFSEQLNEIISRLPDDRQTLLFSATLPKLLVEFARAGLQDPTLIRLDVDTKLSENLQMQFFSARRDEKVPLLVHLLRNVIGTSKLTVVFVATKHHVEFLSEYLALEGIPCTHSYGSLDQTARKINVAKFRAQKVNVLLVTDVAARGIDIPLLDYVVNFDFPPKPKLFVHRVGRVARAGRTGTAFSLVASDEVPYMLDLHLFLGRGVTIAKEENVGSEVEPADSTYGAAPQALLDEGTETMRSVLARKYDVETAYGVMLNAYKMYDKTRELASPSACTRAKQMERDGLAAHPILARAVDSKELHRADLVRGISSYRPTATIFEQTKSTIDPHLEMMARKRRKHEAVIAKQKKVVAITKADQELEQSAESSKRSRKATVAADLAGDDLVSETFSAVVAPGRNKSALGEASMAVAEASTVAVVTKAEEPRVASRPSNEHTDRHLAINFDRAANTVTFDVDGDESSTMQKKKSRMTWDRKKKKYIQEGSVDAVKRIRTESGNLIKASYKGGQYDEWKGRHKLERTVVGTDETGHNTLKSRRGHGARWARQAEEKALKATVSAKAGVVAKDKIVKERKRKAALQARMTKGKKRPGAGGGAGGAKGGAGKKGFVKGKKR